LRSSRFSLGTGYLIKERQSAMRTFMSPAVIRSVIVFFLSAIALFPSHQARFFAALIGGTNSIGAVVSPYITIQVVRTDMTNYIEDYLAYGLLPGLGYLALLVAAVSIYLEKDFGLNSLAGALFAIGDRQHPQRLGPDAHSGPSATPKGLGAGSCGHPSALAMSIG
jgi:hypothetical protein